MQPLWYRHRERRPACGQARIVEGAVPNRWAQCLRWEKRSRAGSMARSLDEEVRRYHSSGGQIRSYEGEMPRVKTQGAVPDAPLTARRLSLTMPVP